jgi:hypothetical protein
MPNDAARPAAGGAKSGAPSHRPPDEICEAVRDAYIANARPLHEIAAAHGITVTRIHAWRRAFEWPSRRPPPDAQSAAATKPAAASGDASPPQRRRQSRRLTAAQRANRQLTERIRTLIHRKLDQMELRMATSDPPNAADMERETRAIGTLIKNLEKVTEIETDRRPSGGRGAGPDGPEGPGAYDNAKADRRRRALAERLERVRERYRKQSPARGD